MKKRQARKNDFKLICVFFLAGLVIFLSNEAMAFSLRLNGEYPLTGMVGERTNVIKYGNRIGIDAVLYEGSTIDLYLGGAFADGMVIRGGVPWSSSDTVDIKTKRKEALLGLRIKFSRIERMNLYVPVEFVYVKGNYEATVSNTATISLIDSASGDFSTGGLRTGLGLDYGLGSNWTLGTALTLGFYADHEISMRNPSRPTERAHVGATPTFLINFGIGVKYSF